MSTFKCTTCNYATHDKSNFSKHNNSKKHKEKVHDVPKLSRNCLVTVIPDINEINKFKCVFCGNSYQNSGNLVRHKTSCSEKHKLYDEVDELRKIINQKDEMITTLKSENTHLKSIVNNSGSIIKTSMSTLAFVIKNYKEAPVLESVKDYTALNYEQDNIAITENLIYEHNHNKLHIYIGDFIIKTYKTENPTKQSIWNSDTSRLTYLIREIIANNKVDWKIDKKGIKTTQFIVDPVLEYINTQIKDYIQNFDINYKLDSAREAENKMMKLKSCTEIIKDIDDKILSEAILKYISPYFYLNKNDTI